MRELMDEQHQPYFGGTPTDETTYANSLSLGLAIMAALILSFWINFNWVYRAIARGKKVLKALLISVGVFHALPLVADMSLLAASEEIPNMFQESVGFADLYFAGFSPDRDDDSLLQRKRQSLAGAGGATSAGHRCNYARPPGTATDKKLALPSQLIRWITVHIIALWAVWWNQIHLYAIMRVLPN